MDFNAKKQDKFIIAMDLDETLLDSYGNVSDFTKETLKKCKERDCVLAISTARGLGSCRDIASEIDADYICCHAGNMIADSDGNVIYKNGFSREQVVEFIDTFNSFTKYFVVDSDSNLYGGDDGEFARSWKVVYCDTKELLEKNAYKICVPYEENYKQAIIDFCEQRGYVCREMRGEALLIVTPGGSDKYYALEKLMEILYTDTNHLIVFGDDTSDMLSIQKAGFGVAMENSRDVVKQNAKIITKSNDEDGVARFLIEKFKLKI